VYEACACNYVVCVCGEGVGMHVCTCAEINDHTPFSPSKNPMTPALGGVGSSLFGVWYPQKSSYKAARLPNVR
jgi:hypothetical protein